MFGKQSQVLTFYGVEEGVPSACILKTDGIQAMEVEIRCQREVALNALTADGELMPLEHGKIVRWRGPVSGYSGVEIVADTGFFYACRKSSKWYEIPDPTPVVIEMKHTQEDVIRTLIDERLRQWKVSQELNRELTDDEKDELVLDIVHGDLEFDEEPDEFGLGYAEALAAFNAKQGGTDDDQRGGVASGDGKAASAAAGSGEGQSEGGSKTPPAG